VSGEGGSLASTPAWARRAGRFIPLDVDPEEHRLASHGIGEGAPGADLIGRLRREIDRRDVIDPGWRSRWLEAHWVEPGDDPDVRPVWTSAQLVLAIVGLLLAISAVAAALLWAGGA
jgi:hypothetical protein